MGSLARLRRLSLGVIVRSDLQLADFRPNICWQASDPLEDGWGLLCWGVKVLPVSVRVLSGSSSTPTILHFTNKLIGDLILTLDVNFLYVSTRP